VTHTAPSGREIRLAAGRLLEAVGDNRPRQMTIPRGFGSGEQNSAYGPAWVDGRTG